MVLFYFYYYGPILLLLLCVTSKEIWYKETLYHFPHLRSCVNQAVQIEVWLYDQFVGNAEGPIFYLLLPAASPRPRHLRQIARRIGVEASSHR